MYQLLCGCVFVSLGRTPRTGVGVIWWLCVSPSEGLPGGFPQQLQHLAFPAAARECPSVFTST